jgi:cofilin
VTAFNELKLNRKYRYIVYRLNEELTKVVIEKKVESCPNYDEFVGNLPEHECRWIVYDFEFQKSPSEGLRSKLIFVAWYCYIE